mmetsp:Transcript_3386/g.4029  ORF Transcript_3386/g.4029 Transcript_3386/m.4029 type:complete len:339 (+) Transcript_3386:73-1089(+)
MRAKNLAVGSAPAFEIDLENLEEYSDGTDSEASESADVDQQQSYSERVKALSYSLYLSALLYVDLALLACLFVLLVVLLILILFFSNSENFNFHGVVGWFFLIVVCLCLCSVPFLIYLGKEAIEERWKNKFRFTVITVVFLLTVFFSLEMLLWRLIPTDSVFPYDNVLATIGSETEPFGHCNISIAFQTAAKFFEQSGLDASKIQVSFDGLARNSGEMSAFDNTIYIARDFCPEFFESWMVYYMTIVWQFQKGEWFGTLGQPFWNFLFRQRGDEDIDPFVLAKYYEERRPMGTLNFRDQAIIVRQHYLLVTYENVEWGWNSESKYIQSFANQILQYAA